MLVLVLLLLSIGVWANDQMDFQPNREACLEACDEYFEGVDELYSCHLFCFYQFDQEKKRLSEKPHPNQEDCIKSCDLHYDQTGELARCHLYCFYQFDPSDEY